jgi:predicted DNA-binding protein YlxM (UPF0122 family)
LVGVGGEFNPEKRNYDYRKVGKGPLEVIFAYEVPEHIRKGIEENSLLRTFFETVDNLVKNQVDYIPTYKLPNLFDKSRNLLDMSEYNPEQHFLDTEKIMEVLAEPEKVNREALTEALRKFRKEFEKLNRNSYLLAKEGKLNLRLGENTLNYLKQVIDEELPNIEENLESKPEALITAMLIYFWNGNEEKMKTLVENIDFYLALHFGNQMGINRLFER